MKNVKILGKHAALLSMIEVGLGSFLHAFRLPLSGQILSLNQIFLMTRASIELKDYQAGSIIGTTSGILKSLSPAGKKLTPMLAITAQGHLFSIGCFVAGCNIIGHILGAIFAGLWSYIQPIAIYLLLFGEDLIFMFHYFVNKINNVIDFKIENFYWIFLGFIILKTILSILAVFTAHYLKEEHIQLYYDWSSKFKPKRNKTTISPFYGALKDMLNPLFILSLIGLFIFFFYSNANYSTLIWSLLRPLAGGFILFYLIRVFPVEKIVKFLKEGKYKMALEETLKNMK